MGGDRPSETEHARELLHWIAFAVDVMRCGVPEKSATKDRIARSFPRAYEAAIGRVWQTIQTELPCLSVTFEPQYFDPAGNTTMVVQWHSGGRPVEASE